MRVEEARRGRSWRLYDGGREVGVIVRARVRSSRPMYAAYSARSGRHRWDLGASTDWDERVSKIAEFDPSVPGVAHRVLAAVVERLLS